MPASQYANENQFNEILLTEQDLVHGGSQSTELLHGAAKFFLREDRGGIHGKLPDFRGFWEKDRAFVRENTLRGLSGKWNCRNICSIC